MIPIKNDLRLRNPGIHSNEINMNFLFPLLFGSQSVPFLLSTIYRRFDGNTAWTLLVGKRTRRAEHESYARILTMIV